MAYQILQGITISPKGNYNSLRFGKNLVRGSWPTAFAFGGWIYNASCEIGYSSSPTEIKLSIVLEVENRAQNYAVFDIKDDDLKCGAGDGGKENLYDIDFNGVTFTDFILYQYDIEIQNETKILNVVFKDYSLILDKIYVGLIKKQGNQFVYTLNANMEFSVVCPDCLLAGDSITMLGRASRDLAFGSYVGINGKVYDNFASTLKVSHIYRQWEQLFELKTEKVTFDLNGGYLILGTEEASEERCGDLAGVSYNFNQLLASLRLRGLKFDGVFPVAVNDADYIYRQNYIGSLREVLQQWCSDLGYDFYCRGKSFIGINLNRAIDISNIVNIADPTTALGSQFAINQNTAILSYKASTSLDNTFKQSVITTNTRAKQSKTHSKAPKRYIGILPLHPIDFNKKSNTPVLRTDVFGTWFWDVAWTNSFEIGHNDREKTLSELDGRTFGDIDTSIALSRYDETLRDLYCQDQAIYGMTEEIRASNFRALGMVPLVELTGVDKSAVIQKIVGGGNGDEISNICLDQRFYKVYVGYYYSSFKEDIQRWEQDAASSMYKYGIVTQGLLNRFPYMSANQLKDLSPSEGFYGEEGTSLLRISHNCEPSITQYYQLKFAPFKDLILYSGLLTPISEALPIAVDQIGTGVFPAGLFYSDIDNEWGTSVEEFKRTMSLNLGDACVQEFSSEDNFTNINNAISKKYQDWNLELFKPKASPNLTEFRGEVAFALNNLPVVSDLDRHIESYYDLHYISQQTCSKLHLLVLTDTRSHPNVYLSFNARGTNFINGTVLQQFIDKEREATKRRIETKTQSICDLSLLQEMCNNLLSGKWVEGGNTDPRYGCIIDENKVNYFTEGFPWEYLIQPNSRGLQIKIVKNPVRNTEIDKLIQAGANSDVYGNLYWADVTSNSLSYTSAEANMTIIYPVSTNALGGYRGVLQSQVDLELRSPEINEIYGEPVNTDNNGTSSIKILNNSVDPDLPPQLDPYSMRFLSYMTVITGETQVLTTVESYHNFIKQINGYELTTPMKSVELSLAGGPSDFGEFVSYLSPDYGLNSLSLSVSDNGLTTSLSFSDRPKVLPRQEAILNKIIPRIK